MKPAILERQLDLCVPREQLWPVLRDTDRLNRAQGLPPIAYHVLPGSDGSVEIEGEFQFAGWRIRWVEHPFEWVEGQRHFVVRSYRNGPLREFRGGLALAGTESGTRLTVRAELHPRNRLGWMIAKMGAPLQAAQALRSQAGSGILSSDDPLLVLLTEYLSTASDRDAARIRPPALAREWNRPGMDVLRSCLRATRAGLLELTWAVICPACRGTKQRVTSLEGLKAEGHCDSCQIRFDLNFDRAVEVSFRPHSRIRKVEEHRFCAYGPGNTPHVLIQLRLEPGGRLREVLLLPKGRYRLRSPEARAATWVEAGREGAPAAVFRIRAEGTETDAPRLAPGAVAVTVENTLPGPARLLLERAEWAQDAATADLVSTVQEFRDLFSTEALSPGTQMSIASLTFLFTDLKGSTSLYTELGDGRAYALVRDHFAFLGEMVRRFEGAIIKTIGDSIMAVFYDPGKAVACGLSVQRNVAEFNRSHSSGPVVLKMGIHNGLPGGAPQRHARLLRQHDERRLSSAVSEPGR